MKCGTSILPIKVDTCCMHDKCGIKVLFIFMILNFFICMFTYILFYKVNDG